MEQVPRETVAPASPTPEKLLCALVPVQSMPAGCVMKTRLGRVALGGGAATGHLVTDHQESERERRSNQTVRLRVCSPDIPAQSVLYI